MKNFEPLTELDRINLNELMTDVRLEVLRKLVDRLVGLHERVQIAPVGADEDQFKYLRRVFNSEGAQAALKELLVYMESESYPEEKPNADGVQ